MLVLALAPIKPPLDDVWAWPPTPTVLVLPALLAFRFELLLVVLLPKRFEAEGVPEPPPELPNMLDPPELIPVPPPPPELIPPPWAKTFAWLPTSSAIVKTASIRIHFMIRFLLFVALNLLSTQLVA